MTKYNARFAVYFAEMYVGLIRDAQRMSSLFWSWPFGDAGAIALIVAAHAIDRLYGTSNAMPYTYYLVYMGKNTVAHDFYLCY